MSMSRLESPAGRPVVDGGLAQCWVDPESTALVGLDVGGVVVGCFLTGDAGDGCDVPVAGGVADPPRVHAGLFCQAMSISTEDGMADMSGVRLRALRCSLICSNRYIEPSASLHEVIRLQLAVNPVIPLRTPIGPRRTMEIRDVERPDLKTLQVASTMHQVACRVEIPSKSTSGSSGMGVKCPAGSRTG